MLTAHPVSVSLRAREVDSQLWENLNDEVFVWHHLNVLDYRVLLFKLRRGERIDVRLNAVLLDSRGGEFVAVPFCVSTIVRVI